MTLKQMLVFQNAHSRQPSNHQQGCNRSTNTSGTGRGTRTCGASSAGEGAAVQRRRRARIVAAAWFAVSDTSVALTYCAHGHGGR